MVNFLFGIQAANYYTEVALENVIEYSRNESNVFIGTALKSRVQWQLSFLE